MLQSFLQEQFHAGNSTISIPNHPANSSLYEEARTSMLKNFNYETPHIITSGLFEGHTQMCINLVNVEQRIEQEKVTFILTSDGIVSKKPVEKNAETIKILANAVNLFIDNLLEKQGHDLYDISVNHSCGWIPHGMELPYGRQHATWIIGPCIGIPSRVQRDHNTIYTLYVSSVNMSPDDFVITFSLRTDRPKVNLTICSESYDHDGYCSGNECTYNSSTYERIVDLPEGLDFKQDLDSWNRYLGIGTKSRSGYGVKSGHCGSKGSKSDDLFKHEHRERVVSVVIKPPKVQLEY